MNILKGKKTIIGSIAAGILVIAHSLNWIDPQTAEMAAGIILAWTGVSFRLAVK